jgi:hypothetical protein
MNPPRYEPGELTTAPRCYDMRRSGASTCRRQYHARPTMRYHPHRWHVASTTTHDPPPKYRSGTNTPSPAQDAADTSNPSPSASSNTKAAGTATDASSTPPKHEPNGSPAHQHHAKASATPATNPSAHAEPSPTSTATPSTTAAHPSANITTATVERQLRWSRPTSGHEPPRRQSHPIPDS